MNRSIKEEEESGKKTKKITKIVHSLFLRLKINKNWSINQEIYKDCQIPIFFGKCFRKNYWIFSEISFFIWKYNPSG